MEILSGSECISSSSCGSKIRLNHKFKKCNCILLFSLIVITTRINPLPFSITKCKVNHAFKCKTKGHHELAEDVYLPLTQQSHWTNNKGATPCFSRGFLTFFLCGYFLIHCGLLVIRASFAHPRKYKSNCHNRLSKPHCIRENLHLRINELSTISTISYLPINEISSIRLFKFQSWGYSYSSSCHLCCSWEFCS